MKKIPFIFLFLGGLLLVNAIPVSTYLNFGEGKHLYEQGAFKESLDFFAGESDAELYNQALALYKTKDFVGAKEVFQKIDTDDEELNFKIAHNLGNIHYRLFEENTDTSQLDEAIESYKSALVFKEDEETRKNLQFVKQKKNELEEKENEEQKDLTPDPSPSEERGEEKEKENSGGDKGDSGEQTGKEDTEKKPEGEESEENAGNKSGEEGEKAEGEETDSEKSEQSEQGETNTENGGSPEQDSSSGKQESVFTEEQKQQLEEYEQNLQNEQMQNSGNYGKVYDNPNAKNNNLFQLLQGDPYFDSGFGNGEEVKDW